MKYKSMLVSGARWKKEMADCSVACDFLKGQLLVMAITDAITVM